MISLSGPCHGAVSSSFIERQFADDSVLSQTLNWIAIKVTLMQTQNQKRSSVFLLLEEDSILK